MRPLREGIEEALHFFVEEAVTLHRSFPLIELRLIGEIAEEQQVCDLEEGAAAGQLFDRIPTMGEYARATIYVRDRRACRCGVGEAGVVCDNAVRRTQLGDIETIVTYAGRHSGELEGVFADL